MEIKDPLACYLVQLLFPANKLQQKEVLEIWDRLPTSPRRSLFYYLLNGKVTVAACAEERGNLLGFYPERPTFEESTCY